MNAKFLAVLVLILTLIIGVLIGMLFVQTPWLPKAGGEHRPPFRPDRGPVDQEFFLRRMTEVLAVTNDQHDTVVAILQSHSDRFLAMHENQRAMMETLMDSLLTDLQGVLTAEQMARFEEHLRERQFRGRGRGPGPRPPALDSGGLP